MAECTLLVWEYLRLDLLTANMDVYNFEAEAMGAKINFYKTTVLILTAIPTLSREMKIWTR